MELTADRWKFFDKMALWLLSGKDSCFFLGEGERINPEAGGMLLNRGVIAILVSSTL